MTPPMHRRSLLVARLLPLVAGAAASSAMSQDCMWTYRGSPGPALSSPAAAFDLSRNLLVFTGWNGANSLQTWEWNAAGAGTWTLRPSALPPLRPGQVMSYDPVRSRTVLFAHTPGTSPTAQTWEWDGNAWLLAATGGPAPRDDAAMTFDPVRARSVLFGGLGGGYLADTWEWDGTTWELRSSSGPPGRYGHAMAYDTHRSRLVMFGGQGPQVVADTWERESLSGIWTQCATAGPSTRSLTSAAYDESRHVTVLYGGVVGSPPTNPTDTWEWDGNAWSLRASGGPFGIQSAGLVFDPARSRVVMAIGGGSVWDYLGSAPGLHPYVAQQPANLQVNPGQSASFHVVAGGTSPYTYKWFRGSGGVLQNGGNISGADSDTLIINPATGADSGSYYAMITNVCGSVISDYAQLFVNEPPPSACYANCDLSTIPPTLNVNDFICFQSRYGAGLPSANCDHSTINPVLNVNDFTCFLNVFAAGCP